MYRVVIGAVVAFISVMASGGYEPVRARELPAQIDGCSASEMQILVKRRQTSINQAEADAARAAFNASVSDTCKDQYTLWVLGKPLQHFESNVPCSSASDQIALADYIETQQLILTGRLSFETAMSRAVHIGLRMSKQCSDAARAVLGGFSETPRPGAPPCALRPLAPDEVCRMPGVGTARSPLPIPH